MGATIRTDENREAILDAVRRGASLNLAAGCAGVSWGAFYNWRKADDSFDASIKKARCECALKKLDKIDKSDQWTAHAWWLERQFPEDFTLVQKIEQVLKQYGLIAPGIAGQLECGPDALPAEPVTD